MSRRSLLIAVLVVAASVVVGVLFLGRAPERTAAPSAKASVTPAAVAVAPEPTSTVAHRVSRTETSFEPVDESKLTAKQAAAAAARYRKAARFPRTSRPLEDGLDPIATSRAPEVGDAGKEMQREPRLLAYPALTVVESPGDVVIFGEVVVLLEIVRVPIDR
jgi:hypothetical protein